MKRTHLFALAAAAAGLTFGSTAVRAQDGVRVAEDGGVHIDGWMGQIDAGEAENGATLDDARLSSDMGVMYVTTGPATTFWNPSNTASGSYTVSATFTEPEYMNVNNHPHPYGIFIGGNDMGTPNMTGLYCTAYGNGTFIVRGFGPAPFQISERRPTPNDAINKAADRMQPVTQEISVSVTAETVSCSINGTEVGSYPKSDIVGDGMLKSTDGVYGIRFSHNTDGEVRNLTMTRN